MDERHIRAFVAVAEHLSFRKAAESLHLSTSPLSRQIKELEFELGATLFERDTRHVRLTSAGHAVLPTAISLLAGMNDLRRGIDRAAKRTRILRVGLRAIPESFRPYLVQALQGQNSDMEVHLEPLESQVQIRQLLGGVLDLTVAFLPPGDARLASWPILTESYVVAVPDVPRFRALKVVLPEHIAGLRLITLTPASQVSSLASATGLSAYFDAADGVVAGADLIPGGIHTLIENGTHFTLVMASPDSPWHKSVAGPGVIMKAISPAIAPLLTSAAWLASRAGSDDLGPMINRVRRAFSEPWDAPGPTSMNMARSTMTRHPPEQPGTSSGRLSRVQETRP